MGVRFSLPAQKMKYTAVVEIPKGSDRRIHMSYDNLGFIDLGPISSQIPVNNGEMPVCYGYIEGTINKDEKDNVDAIIFSSRPHNTGDTLDVEIIGMLTRADGDHKVIAIDDSTAIKNFADIESKERSLILEYFGFKSKINSIDSREKAMSYLESCLV